MKTQNRYSLKPPTTVIIILIPCGWVVPNCGVAIEEPNWNGDAAAFGGALKLKALSGFAAWALAPPKANADEPAPGAAALPVLPPNWKLGFVPNALDGGGDDATAPNAGAARSAALPNGEEDVCGDGVTLPKAAVCWDAELPKPPKPGNAAGACPNFGGPFSGLPAPNWNAPPDWAAALPNLKGSAGDGFSALFAVVNCSVC